MIYILDLTVIQWVPRRYKVLTHGQERLFCKVTSVSIHFFVEWLDTFSYVLRPADVTVKDLYSFPVFLLWNTCACCNWIYITYRTLKRKDGNNNVLKYYNFIMFISMKLWIRVKSRVKINLIFIHTSLLYSNLALLSLVVFVVVVFFFK